VRLLSCLLVLLLCACATAPPAGLPPNPVATAERADEIQHPVVIHRVEPVYPPDLQRARFEAEVVIAGVVPREGGMMRDGKVVSSTDYRFEQAALDAVSRWRWEPGLLNGQPVDMEFTVTVKFSLLRPPDGDARDGEQT
jgi:TonB family protein